MLELRNLTGAFRRLSASATGSVRRLLLCGLWFADLNEPSHVIDDVCHADFGPGVIIPFFVGSKTGLQAAVLSFIACVMPPMAMLGRSLLYVHSQRVAWSYASSMVSNMYCPGHSWRTVRL